MIINLEDLMKRQEKQFCGLCDLGYIGATKVALRIAHRWNRIRKVVEHQKHCIK